MTRAVLRPPHRRWSESFTEAERETLALGGRTDRPDDEDFDSLVARLLGYASGQGLPEGWPCTTVRWLVDGDLYIGSVQIRHELPDWYAQFGGHIGYEVRPSLRGFGYGTRALHLALQEAALMGLEQVLLTCSATNVASRRIIERAGARFDGEAFEPGSREQMRRYWLKTTPTPP